jgi:DNA topoisomerase-1
MLLADDLPSRLTWVDDSRPGISRRRSGRGFSYRDPGGRPVDDATVARIRALAVPPAWTDVWICADPHGHLQATGRDARGRKQYRYHPEYRAHRDKAKFDHLVYFGDALPAIRRRVACDLVRPGVTRDKVVATIVRLLEATLVRVGNEEYARTNDSYGLTTLRNRHAQFTSDGLRLVFRGKHGITTRVKVQDRRLRAVVKQCQDLPGQALFQYLDDEGATVPVSSTEVNEYLRAATAADITAKDFRTWIATLMAATTLATFPPPSTVAEGKHAITEMLTTVSGELRNTPAVCRTSYVHPAILDWFSDGSLQRRWEAASTRGSRLLLADERKLLRLLHTASRRRAPRATAA